MAEGHLKAADLKVDLGEHLTAVLYWVREPEMRALRLAQGGSGRSVGAVIAEAMFQAGRAAAQRLGHAGDVDPALHKLESIALSYLRAGVRLTEAKRWGRLKWAVRRAVSPL